jgi:hypothetical protein
MKPDELVNHVRNNATAMVGLDWQPFCRILQIRFRSYTGDSFGLHVTGVHLFSTRQSLIGQWDYNPLTEDHWEDWEIHYFDLLAESELLKRLLDQSLGTPSQVMVHSLNGEPIESARFTRPMHLALVCGGGHMDILCEGIELMGIKLKRPLGRTDAS